MTASAPAATGFTGYARTLAYPGLTIEIPDAAHPVRLNRAVSTLPPHCCKVLAILAQSAGMVVSTREIAEKMRTHVREANRKSPSVSVCIIRKAFEAACPGSRHHIQNVHSGYRMRVPSPAESAIVLSVRRGDSRLAIDQYARAWVNGTEVSLSGQQFGLLKMLLEHPDVALSKRHMLGHMYPKEYVRPEYKIIDVIVCHIRRKIEDADPRLTGLIETVWGHGYMIRSRALPDTVRSPLSIPAGLSPQQREDAEALIKHLPHAEQRWTPARKESLLKLVNGFHVPLYAVLQKYPALTTEEFDRWQSAYTDGGRNRLRVTTYDYHLDA